MTARRVSHLRDGAGADDRTAAAGENPELRDMTRRFWTSVLLGVPLVALAMLRMGPLMHVLSPRLATWIEFALATPGCPMVRLALLRAGLGVRQVSQPEHVHPDRDGRGRGLHL